MIFFYSLSLTYLLIDVFFYLLLLLYLLMPSSFIILTWFLFGILILISAGPFFEADFRFSSSLISCLLSVCSRRLRRGHYWLQVHHTVSIYIWFIFCLWWRIVLLYFSCNWPSYRDCLKGPTSRQRTPWRLHLSRSDSCERRPWCQRRWLQGDKGWQGRRDGLLLECVTERAGAVHDLYAHGEDYDGLYE